MQLKLRMPIEVLATVLELVAFVAWMLPTRSSTTILPLAELKSLLSSLVMEYATSRKMEIRTKNLWIPQWHSSRSMVQQYTR